METVCMTDDRFVTWCWKPPVCDTACAGRNRGHVGVAAENITNGNCVTMFLLEPMIINQIQVQMAEDEM